ncbi:MAG: lysis system i-spanin subunit Rz [bacterium]|nr:lysis system i-spanin subunit Rz [bacterium]
MSIIPLPYRVLAILLLIAACIGFGWVKGGEHANLAWELRQAKAEQAADIQHQARIVADAAIDAAKTKELQEKQDENDRLDAAVATGNVRLRLAGHCPVPANASGGSVDIGAEPELDAAARPTYRALRGGITRQEVKLSACQAILSSWQK